MYNRKPSFYRFLISGGNSIRNYLRNDTSNALAMSHLLRNLMCVGHVITSYQTGASIISKSIDLLDS